MAESISDEIGPIFFMDNVEVRLCPCEDGCPDCEWNGYIIIVYEIGEVLH